MNDRFWGFEKKNYRYAFGRGQYLLTRQRVETMYFLMSENLTNHPFRHFKIIFLCKFSLILLLQEWK